MKPNLYLITQEYPYGHIEDTFVKPEYPYLCEKFHVTIIAAELNRKADTAQDGIVGAHVISTRQSTAEKMLSLLRFLCERDCYIELASIVRGRRKILQRIYRSLMFGTAAETFYRRLKRETGLSRDTDAVFYFYWFDYKCFGLTMHKHCFPRIRIVARTHGYDLYDERELYGKQFFKPQMDARTDRLVFAAQYAKDYYLRRYQRQDSAKYPLCCLGVFDKGMTEERRREEIDESTFLMVSCSNAERIKRIDRIIDGLTMVNDRKVRWVHIGGGSQLKELQEMAAQKLNGKSNIQYEFTGAIGNSQVIEYYREHYVSCFITTTETEGGSPVSVQEALSFGVPVIATAVGELPRMIDGNGILLSENTSREETGRAITDFVIGYGTEEYFEMCGHSLKIFRNQFDEKKNFTAFAEELQQMYMI